MYMAMKFAGSLVLVVLVTTSVFARDIANKTYQDGSCPPCSCPGWPWWNVTHKPKTINVGGEQNWQFGVNYAAWAFNYSLSKHFLVGDTLVFHYTTEHPHNVLLMPNFQSYNSCDVSRGKLIGGPDDGIEGVKFTLEPNPPFTDQFLYFVCGAKNGFHCSAGLMKFAVWPLFPISRPH